MNREGPITFECDTAIYRLSAIKKTAYKFADRCHFEISLDGTRAVVRLHVKHASLNQNSLERDFKNELLDQELREELAQETASIRNLLIAQAFSATSLLDPLGETGNEEADPLQIRPSDATRTKSG